MRPTIDVSGVELYECFECGARTSSADTTTCEECGGAVRNIGVERDY